MVAACFVLAVQCGLKFLFGASWIEDVFVCVCTQNKTCVQTLEGHAQNVSAVAFHPELPLIITGSEDGTIRVWHANTYRLETTLNYGLERVWCMAHTRSSNNVAIGYDEGSIIVKVCLVVSETLLDR